MGTTLVMARPVLKPKDEVVELFKSGLGNDAIAEKTNYSVRYVENLRYSLRKEGLIGPPIGHYSKGVMDTLELEECELPVKFRPSNEVLRAQRILRELRKDPESWESLMLSISDIVEAHPKVLEDNKRLLNINAAQAADLKIYKQRDKDRQERDLKIKYVEQQGDIRGD